MPQPAGTLAVGSGALLGKSMIPNIPDEIIQAANKVAHWMRQNGHDHWELADICSRDHTEELKAYREGGVTEEILRRNDKSRVAILATETDLELLISALFMSRNSQPMLPESYNELRRDLEQLKSAAFPPNVRISSADRKP